jgi:hypothetical protein
MPGELKYKYTKQANRDVMMMITRHLNSRINTVRWKYRTAEQIAKEYGSDYMSSNGLFKANGDVVINADKATIETPFHEFGHVYLQYLAKNDPDEYKEIMGLMKEHAIFESVRDTYKALSEDEAAEEAFCELLSLSATSKLLDVNNEKSTELLGKLANESGNYGKVTSALNEVFADVFGTEIDLRITGSLSTIMDSLTNEILFGTQSMLNAFSNETKEAIRKSRSSAVLTTKEARDVLINRGYMRWICD